MQKVMAITISDAATAIQTFDDCARRHPHFHALAGDEWLQTAPLIDVGLINDYYTDVMQDYVVFR